MRHAGTTLALTTAVGRERIMADMAAAPKPTEVQTLIFDKKKFSPSEAKAWCKSHDFYYGEPDITDESIRIRQEDPGKFVPGSFRTIELAPGIKGVIGKHKQATAADLRDIPVFKRILNHASVSFENPGVERASPDGPPTAFRIWHQGMNVTDHGEHILTPESMERLLEDQEIRGNRFSIDVDHLSLSQTAPPEARKAVGYFSIENRNGDLWAIDVEWTKVASDGLTAKPPEWKYFSPAYETKKDNGEIVKLLNIALTNNPATWNVTALATSAATKEQPMDYEKMSLAALMAAYDEEKDEDKRAKMKAAIKAKYAAEFGDPGERHPDETGGEDEKKKDEDKRSKAKKANEGEGGEDEKKKDEDKRAKAKAAEGEPDADDKPKKDEDKRSTETDEEKANRIAASALVKFEAAQKAASEKAELTRILASLPAGDRKTYEGLNLEQVKKIVARHHADVLTQFNAASSVSHTRGLGDAQGTPGFTHAHLPATEKAALDAQMNLASAKPIIEQHEDGRLIFHGGSPEAANQFTASLTKERSTGAHPAEALNRVLATQKVGG